MHTNLYAKLSGEVYQNLSLPKIIEHEIINKEGILGNKGEVICSSGKYTGRCPKDKFFVEEEGSKKHIWWGEVNQKLTPRAFDIIEKNIFNFISNKRIYINDGYAGTAKQYQLKIRFFNTKAWHAHFVHNMFIRPSKNDLVNFLPNFTVVNACEYVEKDWKNLGLNSEKFIVINLKKKIILIAGTQYAGEIKKGIFSVLNYLLPIKNVLPMHCSATVGTKNDVAIYFGLSGTGKTTLSADHNRQLIGDDEHGWDAKGVFNFEGGCYAKALRLSPHIEPDIWNAIRYGTILENVTFDKESRRVNFEDASITENSRISYPIEYILNNRPAGKAGHPKYIFMLACDAFGVLPPVAKLEIGQASYHFLSGYTAKIAGTEAGLKTPIATFSTCFGKPFMSQSPKIYSNLLSTKMKKHHTKAYLINTGWLGKLTDKRIDLPITRQIVSNVLNGDLDKAEFFRDPVFGFSVPKNLPNIPEKILNPKFAWQDEAEYKKNCHNLANMFIENFKINHFTYAKDLAEYGPIV